MESDNAQGTPGGEVPTLIRCERCGVESAERTCFIVPAPHSRPPHYVRCITCEQRRLTPSTFQGVIAVIGTLIFPVLLVAGRGTDAPGFATLVFACLLFPAAIVAHELGHALTAYLVGLEVGAIGIGFGPVVSKFTVGELPIRLHRWPLSGRVYLGASSAHLLRTRLWIATLMGPMTNGLLVAATSIWRQPLESNFGSVAVSMWLTVNVLLIFAALIPHRANDPGSRIPSDGLALLTIPRETSSQLARYLVSTPVIRGMSLFEDADYTRCAKLLQTALKTGPASPLLRLILSGCLMWEGDYHGGLDALGPLAGDSAAEAATIRGSIYNNTAFGLFMSRDGSDGAQLLEADRLSANAFAMFPCALEVRGTRALVLAATHRAEKALQLLDYPHFLTGTPVQKAGRELSRAFALHQQNRLAEAADAAALAIQLHPATANALRVLGIKASTTVAGPSPSLSHASPITFDADPLSGGHAVLARIAGLVLLIFGLGCGALTVIGVRRNPTSLTTMALSTLVFLIVFAALTVFCCAIGYRLAFNRPNRHGSLLPPMAWISLSAAFGALGIFFATRVFISLSNAGGIIIGALSSFMLAALCWKSRSSP